jgi:signal transduction histidine kinase
VRVVLGRVRPKLAVSIVSVLAYALVGALTAPPELDLRLFLAPPLYLFVLGYLIAVWGGHEMRSRRRLALLRDVATLANPRFGVEPTIGRILETLRTYYRADSCRLIVADEAGGRTWMRTALRAGAVPASRPSAGWRGPCRAASGRHLLVRRWHARVACTPARPTSGGELCRRMALLTAFDRGALIGAPFRYHASAPGRFTSRAACCGRSTQRRRVLQQVVTRSCRCTTCGSSISSPPTRHEERRRIALDLHDSVIQPYLGLRLGISAARAALGAGRGDEARAHLGRLEELADGELQTLRGYVRDLRAGATAQGGGLEAAVRRFCRRFSDATGVRVEVTTEGPPIADRIGAEVFQMVAEALSNVRRHTAAARADVRIETADGQVRVTVANVVAPAEPVAFFPRSLGERAAALGGHLTIDQPARGTTGANADPHQRRS